MSDPLKVGDRVRVKAGRRIPHYPAGEGGTVNRVPQTSASGTTYYLVMMDKDNLSVTVIFKRRRNRGRRGNTGSSSP